MGNREHAFRHLADLSVVSSLSVACSIAETHCQSVTDSRKHVRGQTFRDTSTHHCHAAGTITTLEERQNPSFPTANAVGNPGDSDAGHP